MNDFYCTVCGEKLVFAGDRIEIRYAEAAGTPYGVKITILRCPNYLASFSDQYTTNGHAHKVIEEII